MKPIRNAQAPSSARPPQVRAAQGHGPRSMAAARSRKFGVRSRCAGRRRWFASLQILAAVTLPAAAMPAEAWLLPTANRALFEPGGEGKFFAGTAGKPWTSGTFGCVRSEGRQFQEGLDIRCLQRDGRGEPIDPVLA